MPWRMTIFSFETWAAFLREGLFWGEARRQARTDEPVSQHGNAVATDEERVDNATFDAWGLWPVI